MTHATRARKERGAKIVAVDVYMNGTMEQADLPVLVKPGTDGALACAVMHCLFRDGKADWDYLDKYTDAPRELEAHVRDARSAMGVGDHRLPGRDHRGVRPARRRNQARLFPARLRLLRARATAPVNMHAASCIPAVTGAWLHEGGGAFHNNADIYHSDKTMIEGLDVRDPSVRMLDQSRIGAILTGDREALHGGPPVDGDADPEHQSGVGRARPGAWSSAALRARTCSSACTSSS